MRRQADSNRCGSFCRAQPSHSAMTPKNQVANLTKKLHFTIKNFSIYLFSNKYNLVVNLVLYPFLFLLI